MRERRDLSRKETAAMLRYDLPTDPRLEAANDRDPQAVSPELSERPVALGKPRPQVLWLQTYAPATRLDL